MYTATVDPRRVAPYEHSWTIPKYEKLAKEDRLGEAGQILTFELPEIYNGLGDYVIINGHKRREAAIRHKVDLDILVLESPEDCKEISEYAPRQYPEYAPWQYSSEDRFEETKRGYALGAVRAIDENRVRSVPN